MTDSDIEQTDQIEAQRDKTLTTVREHLSDVAEAVATLRNESYGKLTLSTESGYKYTLKHEDGSVEWFRRDDSGGTYIISTKGDPAATEVVDGMEGYDEWITSVNEWIRIQGEGLSSAEDTLAEMEWKIEMVEELSEQVAEVRDDVTEQLWDALDTVAGVVKQTLGDQYGKLNSEVDGTEWTIKYQDDGSAKYLKVGGDYPLGNDDPSPKQAVMVAKGFEEWVENINDWLERNEQEMRLTVDVSEVEAPVVDVQARGDSDEN
ncbi:hypothetical protein [Halovenus sp. HT40]|uniref:hypothetical protein n=1 Tax=Halovenus sp. HT40 TaxID=3126691 RepID=UPI00300EB6B8